MRVAATQITRDANPCDALGKASPAAPPEERSAGAPALLVPGLLVLVRLLIAADCAWIPHRLCVHVAPTQSHGCGCRPDVNPDARNNQPDARITPVLASHTYLRAARVVTEQPHHGCTCCLSRAARWSAHTIRLFVSGCYTPTAMAMPHALALPRPCTPPHFLPLSTATPAPHLQP